MSRYRAFLKAAVLHGVTNNPVIRLALKKMISTGCVTDATYRRLPVEEAFPVRMPNGGSFIYSSVREDPIGRYLFWESWEAESTAVFQELAKRAKLVLDIGANTGLYTLLTCAANPDANVIAFEPVPRTHSRLVNNVMINGWMARCQIRPEAVSNATGSVKFHVPNTALPSCACLDPNGFKGYDGSLIDVNVTTVDAAIGKNARVDLVKIDVEGFEDKVLEGMQRVMATSAPAIVVECIPDGPFGAVESIVKDFGYRIFHLQKERPAVVDRIVPDVDGLYRNFLCVPCDDWRDYRTI